MTGETSAPSVEPGTPTPVDIHTALSTPLTKAGRDAAIQWAGEPSQCDLCRLSPDGSICHMCELTLRWEATARALEAEITRLTTSEQLSAELGKTLLAEIARLTAELDAREEQWLLADATVARQKSEIEDLEVRLAEVETLRSALQVATGENDGADGRRREIAEYCSARTLAFFDSLLAERGEPVAFCLRRTAGGVFVSLFHGHEPERARQVASNLGPDWIVVPLYAEPLHA